MQTCRADAARFERVPLRATSAVEILGVIAAPANPRIASLRLPFTKRAADAGDFSIVNFVQNRFVEIFRLVTKPEKPKVCESVKND